jgi:hypothetical protein
MAGRVALAAGTLTVVSSVPASAQGDPNTGALTFTAVVDIPSTYYFRGIKQEEDPAFTLWPYADLGLALFSGDGTLRRAGVNVGVWNSLHTGSSGSGADGPGYLHYEEDFYATLALGFSGGISLATTYTAYTSPNGVFDTINEVSFRVSRAQALAPYVLLAIELGDGSALGADTGTYLELGVGPSFALGGSSATVAVPAKLGMSLGDYYESPVNGEDEKFGYLSVGGLVTWPLSGVASRFGSWNVHAGADLLFLGDTPEQFNTSPGDAEPGNTAVVALVGIGVSY